MCLLSRSVSSAVTASLQRDMFVDFALLLHKNRPCSLLLGAGVVAFVSDYRCWSNWPSHRFKSINSNPEFILF